MLNNSGRESLCVHMSIIIIWVHRSQIIRMQFAVRALAGSIIHRSDRHK